MPSPLSLKHPSCVSTSTRPSSVLHCGHLCTTYGWPPTTHRAETTGMCLTPLAGTLRVPSGLSLSKLLCSAWSHSKARLCSRGSKCSQEGLPILHTDHLWDTLRSGLSTAAVTGHTQQWEHGLNPEVCCASELHARFQKQSMKTKNRRYPCQQYFYNSYV